MAHLPFSSIEFLGENLRRQCGRVVPRNALRRAVGLDDARRFVVVRDEHRQWLLPGAAGGEARPDRRVREGIGFRD